MIRAEKSIRQGPCESGTNDQGRVENAIYLRKIPNFEPKKKPDVWMIIFID